MAKIVKITQNPGSYHPAVGRDFTVILDNGAQHHMDDDDFLCAYDQMRDTDHVPSLEEMNTALVGAEWFTFDY